MIIIGHMFTEHWLIQVQCILYGAAHETDYWKLDLRIPESV